jgi:FkbM family methyltransferase
MTSHPPRKLAFVLAASDHGTMIVNRYDYHFVDQNRGFGVGLDILETAAFDRDGVDFAAGLLTLRRQYYGDGVVAIDCGANIGVFTLEWARAMTGWGSVIAIEAQERIYYALAGNIAVNNCFNARAVLAAAADKPGTMKVPKLDYGRPASFGSVEIKQRERTESIGQPLDYTNAATNEVVCVTLDSFNLPRVDLCAAIVEYRAACSPSREDEHATVAVETSAGNNSTARASAEIDLLRAAADKRVADPKTARGRSPRYYC